MVAEWSFFMKIAVIGATGKAGSLIAREASGRGHDVTAVIKPGSANRLEKAYTILERDIFELTADDLSGFDAVVDAFGTPSSKPGSEHLHQDSMESLIKVFSQLPDTRLLVVGGAGSLFDKERGLNVIEDIPKDFRAVPENMAMAFEKLKASSINWTYLSPAKVFDAGGPRTGKYTIGMDYVIPNGAGESYASYADYAVAMVDEIENRAFIRKRFTIVSDTPFNQDTDQLFNIMSTPFFRHLGYMGVFASMRSGSGYGQGALYVGSRRGAANAFGKVNLIDFAPTYNGEKTPYSVKTSATQLTLCSRLGDIRICFAEPSLMMIEGDKGMGLRFEKIMEMHEIMKPRGEDAWEGVFRWVSSVVFKPLAGKLVVDAPWKWEELTTPRVTMNMTPDDGGTILLALEDFTHAGWVRDSYPSYREALANVTQDWEGFLKTIPRFDVQLEERREEAAYILWSHLAGPSGKIKRPLMYMFGTGCASEWQMCQNAVALGSIDLALSTELLLNMFDEASPVGQLPDFYDDMRGLNQLIKPPLQGWALKLLMQKHDLGAKIPKDKLEALYTGCSNWANWFMIYRDDDHDGIPQFEHGDETGGDDVSVFKYNPIMETPDLCSYLGLLFEALGDIAQMLGREQAEADDWRRRSKEIIEKMIGAMWNGERFVALVNRTHEVVATDSYLYYLPIILGKRLPAAIIDKLADDLAVEGDLLTRYGFASEKLSSRDFRLAARMSLGSILPAVNILLCTGLMDAGKTDLAKLAARRYCQAMKERGLSMIVNPFSGPMMASGGSWPACAYTILSTICNS